MKIVQKKRNYTAKNGTKSTYVDGYSISITAKELRFCELIEKNGKVAEIDATFARGKIIISKKEKKMNTKKNWVMIVENNIDAIQKAIEEAYIEMHERSSGWRIEISIDEDGEVQSSCLLSQNTKVHYDAVDCVCLHDVESWRYIDICDNIEEFEQADEETKNEMVREYVESAEFGVMDMIDRAIENLK